VVEKEGFILYDVEYVEKQRKLIVTIDKTGGVSIDDCANVSRALNLLLDVENIVPGEDPYDLEVSSPGLERALKKLWHFEFIKNTNEKITDYNFQIEKNIDLKIGKRKFLKIIVK
jgi:ribosome maturation factor RimP